MYNLKKEDDTTMQDHIKTFNKLVCQLLNADEKLSDEKKALLILPSLLKSYINIVQTFVIGRESISTNQALPTLKEHDRFMVRCEGGREECGKGLYSKGCIRGKTKKKRCEGVSIKGGVTSVTKSITIVRKKGHIQIMCKEVKEDLKRMRNLRDGGRKDVETSGDIVLGFIDDEGDYDGALLVEGGAIYSKKSVIDFYSLIHISCEKEKFAKLSLCDGGLITLPNDERVKVEGIGDI